MSRSVLSETIISQDEVERITGLEISSTHIAGVYRFKPFSSSSNLVAAIVNESLWLGLIAIFVLPIVAIALTRFAQIMLFNLFSLGATFCLIIYCGRWFYLHSKKQGLRNTFILLEQIDRHNKVIQSLDVIQQFSNVKPSDSWVQHSSNIVECLNTNRETLVCALMMDAIARKNRLSTLQRVELLATVEDNLEFIRAMSDRSDEYTHLINEVLTINLKVTEEMKNINLP